MADKKDFLTDWSESIRNMKTTVKRVFHKGDTDRKTPYIFDGWRRDYLTGEKLISLHTKKHWDDKLDGYLSIVMSQETFQKEFVEVDVEI